MHRMNTKNRKFAEIKKAYVPVELETAKTLTQYVDHLLFKSRTLNEVFEKIQEAKELRFKDSKDFKNMSILKKHVKYRANHDKFVVNFTKKGKVRLASLLDN